jgi:hypothetical protein
MLLTMYVLLHCLYFICISLLRFELLAMKRVGILAGGVECPAEHVIPPSQKLYIAESVQDLSSCRAEK